MRTGTSLHHGETGRNNTSLFCDGNVLVRAGSAGCRSYFCSWYKLVLLQTFPNRVRSLFLLKIQRLFAKREI